MELQSSVISYVVHGEPVDFDGCLRFVEVNRFEKFRWSIKDKNQLICKVVFIIWINVLVRDTSKTIGRTLF